jgi:hypothetical protein
MPVPCKTSLRLSLSTAPTAQQFVSAVQETPARSLEASVPPNGSAVVTVRHALPFQCRLSLSEPDVAESEPHRPAVASGSACQGVERALGPAVVGRTRAGHVDCAPFAAVPVQDLVVEYAAAGSDSPGRADGPAVRRRGAPDRRQRADIAGLDAAGVRRARSRRRWRTTPSLDGVTQDQAGRAAATNRR